MPERDIVERLDDEIEAQEIRSDELEDERILYDARAEIQRLRADAGWVRVEDGLPEDERMVVAFCHGLGGNPWQEVAYVDAGRWYTSDGSEMYWPTHWRPLPPAPERGA